jgi:hypothetical protein
MIELINSKYIEWYQEEVTQPEIIEVTGNSYTFIGTGHDEISLPCVENAVVGPQKKVKIWNQRIKPEYQHLPLIDLLR